MFEKFQPEDEELNWIREWVKAAAADGWQVEPTYESEGVERAARGTKKGFVFQAVMRPGQYGGLHLWAPDSLALTLLDFNYSWTAITESVKVCVYCRKENGPVQRIGFAGRTCNECHVKNVKKIEFPGWTN